MPPWITTRALEQANDTKELNRAQPPLPGGGKLVDNSGGSLVPLRHGSRPSRLASVPGVDAAPPGLAPSTGYRRVFPRGLSIDGSPGGDRDRPAHADTPRARTPPRFPSQWRASRRDGRGTDGAPPGWRVDPSPRRGRPTLASDVPNLRPSPPAGLRRTGDILTPGETSRFARVLSSAKGDAGTGLGRPRAGTTDRGISFGIAE